MKKPPKLMDLPKMQDILGPHSEQLSHHIFINGELAVLHGGANIFPLLMVQEPPFVVNDHRLGIVIGGEAHLNLNLVDRHYKAGTLLFVGPGSVISPKSITPDFSVCGIGISAQFPLPFPSGELPTLLSGQVRDFQAEASESDISIARHIVDTLWHVVHQPNLNWRTASQLVGAQICHYDSLLHRLSERTQSSRTREQDIFERFLSQVNAHGMQQHRLAFYAEKACLTERYLGSVVRQASGMTAKEWIDRSLVTRIKVELRHSEKSIAQIAEEAHFSSVPSFCKFFKRLTGKTPMEFRQD